MDRPSSPVALAAATPVDAEARTTLFRTVADGKRHPRRALARLLGTDDDTVDRIVAGLVASDMALRCAGGTVRSPPFVPLDPSAIERHLSGGPWRVRVAFETRSTNDDLLRELRAGKDADRPRLLAAEVQHAGRGRLGRRWASAPGLSLAVSFGFRIGRPLGDLDGVTLACGLAVQAVVAEFGVDARLKWPNDLLVGRRKLAGILVEAQAEGGATRLIVGVGINVAFAPAIATSGMEPARLQAADAPPIDRNRLAARLGLALDETVCAFAGSGFAPFADRWNERDAYRGRVVVAGGVAGVARGVDSTGALRLEVDGVVRRVIAGDLSLRESARETT